MRRPLAVAASSARPDELDDLVDVEDRHEQTLDEVQTLLAPRQPVGRAAAHDADPEVDEDPTAAPSPSVRGCPSTSATLLIPNESSIGVSR
jgi:hypothetical protein